MYYFSSFCHSQAGHLLHKYQTRMCSLSQTASYTRKGVRYKCFNQIFLEQKYSCKIDKSFSKVDFHYTHTLRVVRNANQLSINKHIHGPADLLSAMSAKIILNTAHANSSSNVAQPVQCFSWHRLLSNGTRELVITTWKVVYTEWRSSGAVMRTLLLWNANIVAKRLFIQANVNNLAS